MNFLTCLFLLLASGERNPELQLAASNTVILLSSNTNNITIMLIRWLLILASRLLLYVANDSITRNSYTPVYSIHSLHSIQYTCIHTIGV